MGSDKPARPVVTQLSDWNSLPPEIHDLILARLPLDDIFKAPLVCRDFRDTTKRATFHHVRACLCPLECCLSALALRWERGVGLYMRGLDWKHQIWRKLPPIRALDLTVVIDDIQYVAGHVGLVCLTVEKLNRKTELYVCNPLTGETQMLPTFKLSNRPFAIHVHVTLANRNVDVISSSYWVVAIGYVKDSRSTNPWKMGVYDSVTGKWEASDWPFDGCEFLSSSRSQTLYCKSLNLLLCMGLLADGKERSFAFDMEARKWREDWICPLTSWFYDSVSGLKWEVLFSSTELLECSGRIYLVTAKKLNGILVNLWVLKLDLDRQRAGHVWTGILALTLPSCNIQSPVVYPEYICMQVGKNILCIFNSMLNFGMVYDVLQVPATQLEVFQNLSAPPFEEGFMSHDVLCKEDSFTPSFGVSAK